MCGILAKEEGLDRSSLSENRWTVPEQEVRQGTEVSRLSSP